MDLISHGLWSYLIWRSWSVPGLAILFGIIPDLLSFGPLITYNLLRRRGVVDTRGLPRAITWCRFTLHRYTHSMLLAVGVAAATLLALPQAWWILAWPLHILVDIFTHHGDSATRYLHPVSRHAVHSPVHWSGKRFLIANAALLAASYALWVF